MPAPTGGGVHGALRLALSDGGPSASASTPKATGDARLEAKLGGGARASLLTPIAFEEAGSYHRDPLHSIKAKYLLLRPEDAGSERTACRATAKGEQENGLPSPERVLFPLSAVRHGWRHGWRVGSGMHNVGNTCYLNSTLQALFHVSAFANWLVSEEHVDECGHDDGCIICGMKKTLMDTQKSNGPIKPWHVYSNLRSICRHLTPGRQEDAHEFLRYLVEAMEKAYLSRFDCSRLDQYSKETTPLNQILGGYLRSVVRCLSCNRVSTTFQHFQDLLVDARKASTIDEALETFFSREHLEDLGYKCEFCNKKVSATKQFFVERAPMVLCIALKRFSITGGKLTKHVQFKQRLLLNKYMHNQNPSRQLCYRLVSVVTHLGQSQNCGHYTAVGYGPAGSFYQFDDSCVREIALSSVLNTNAYIMFYELNVPSGSPNKNNIKNIIPSPNRSLKESKENIPNSTFKSLKDIDAENTQEDDSDKEKSSIVGKFKPIGSSNSFIKTSFYKPNENGFRDMSKEKSILGFSSGDIKPNDRKINNTSTNISNSLNKIVYYNTNGQSASSNSVSASASAVNKTSDNSNDRHSDQKYHLNIKVQNKLTNGIHKINEHGVHNNETKAIRKSPNRSSPTDRASTNFDNVKIQIKANGSSTAISSLVPYDSDGDNNDDEDDDNDEIGDARDGKNHNMSGSKNEKTKKDDSMTTATSQGWKVSRENHEDKPVSNSLKSSSSKSPDCDESQSQLNVSRDNSHKEKETLRQLQSMSHRGYGTPMSTWNGTHSQLNRQVFEDKKSESKRMADADDEMDRGRVKKVKYNTYSHKYYDRRHSNYNGFQDAQNHINKWGSKNSYKKFHHYNRNFKHKSRGRFSSHYPRHHSSSHYHQYNRNH